MAERLYGAHGDIAVWRKNTDKAYSERVHRRVDRDATQNTSREAYFVHAGEIVIHEPLGPAFFQSLSLNWGYALANGAFIWALASSIGSSYFDARRALDTVTGAVVGKNTAIGDPNGQLGTLLTLRDPTERWKFTDPGEGQNLLIGYYQDLKQAYESDPKGLLAAVDAYIGQVQKNNDTLESQGALTPAKQMDLRNLFTNREVLASCVTPDPEHDAPPLSFRACLNKLGVPNSDIDKIDAHRRVEVK